MLIGIDASRANRSHKSGTEWYSYYIIRWLAKLDANNQYILYTDKPLSGGLLNLTGEQYCGNMDERQSVRYDSGGYQILKSPYGNFRAKILDWPFDFFWTQGRLSIEMLIKRPDVLFIPAHSMPIIHPRRTVVTIHDIGFEWNSRLYRREKMGPRNIGAKKIINTLIKLFTWGKYGADTVDYLRWSTGYAVKKAARVITVSNFSKKELERSYKADSGKIRVIHNGYNRYLFHRISDDKAVKRILSKYGISGPYLFYVGRLERKKNIPALIESFAIMRGNNSGIRHKLVLAGDASFGYDEVNYMIEEFNLDNEVIMPGWVPEEELSYFYSGATAFVFPSYYEGFGIPLLQAMACGVPIITSYVCSIPEVVGEAALFFDPHNVRSMARAMKKIIIDENLQKQLIESGGRRIKNFSWEKCAQETLDVITARWRGGFKT